MTLAEFRRQHAVRASTLNGAEWSWVAAGSGPCLVLLPGAQGTAEVFFKQFALADRWRVVAVTYPAQTDGAVLADGLAGFLDSLGIARASLAGTSLGGYVAQLFAARHPERVEKLILTCTFVDPGPVQAPEKLAAARDTPADTLKQQALGRVRAAPEGELKGVQLDLIGEKQSAANIQARMLAVQMAQPVPPLTIAPGDITVIDCDNDPVIPPAVRAAVRERYAGAGHFNIAGGSHYPYILCGDEYNRIVAARLA